MKIPIKKYVDDPSLTWEERYARLDAHHLEETQWMMNRIKELEAAIKKHREQTGHEMCWENDEELWAVLGDDVKVDHTPPEWCEFIQKCAEYRKSRERDGHPTDND